MNDTIEQLKQALSQHDWYFDRTDDHTVWRQGMVNWDTIQRLMQQCHYEGHGEHAEQLLKSARSKR